MTTYIYTILNTTAYYLGSGLCFVGDTLQYWGHRLSRREYPPMSSQLNLMAAADADQSTNGSGDNTDIMYDLNGNPSIPGPEITGTWELRRDAVARNDTILRRDTIARNDKYTFPRYPMCSPHIPIKEYDPDNFNINEVEELVLYVPKSDTICGDNN